MLRRSYPLGSESKRREARRDNPHATLPTPRHLHPNPRRFQQFGKWRGRVSVGEEAVDLRQLGDFDHRGAVEFADVGGQPDRAGLRNDGLCDLHFAQVEVAQRAVGLNAGRADQRNVDLELAYEIDRRFADDGEVARAHQAASDDDFAIGIGTQRDRHVQVVGDHTQAAVTQQGPGDRFGRGADVDEQRTVLRHLLGDRAGDA